MHAIMKRSTGLMISLRRNSQLVCGKAKFLLSTTQLYSKEVLHGEQARKKGYKLKDSHWIDKALDTLTESADLLKDDVVLGIENNGSYALPELQNILVYYSPLLSKRGIIKLLMSVCQSVCVC